MKKDTLVRALVRIEKDLAERAESLGEYGKLAMLMQSQLVGLIAASINEEEEKETDK
jgi:hypothetical protein